MTDKQKNLIVRSITGTLFVAILVTCFLDPTAMTAIFALVTGLGIWEFTGLVNQKEDINVNRAITTVAGVYFSFAVAGINSGTVNSNAVFIPYLLTIIYLLVIGLYSNNVNALHDWAYTMLSQMYIALPLSTIHVLAFRSAADQMIHYHYILPLSVFIFLWVSDTGAYCVGSLLGKHKLFPRISPNKSWEGSIGGGVLVLLAAGLMWWIEQQYGNASGLSLFQWLGMGLVVTVFGTWGDLVESLLKRTLGVKDSGTILPGHGGILDRFDSSLLAIPATVVYLYTLTLF